VDPMMGKDYKSETINVTNDVFGDLVRNNVSVLSEELIDL
jgi:hypothetical protein